MATTAQLVEALNHPIRRSLLRVIGENTSLSSVEARKRLGFRGGHNNYHFDILVKSKALNRTQALGKREYIYTCAPATGATWFQEVLRLSAEEDKFL
jgi:hypothetical protein